jgi:putative flavoprotein involved in K+ transport
VFLSVSSHERIRRSYRGKDCIWWLIATGAADATWDERTGMRLSRLMTGVGGGHDIDLRALAAAGVVLLGRVDGVEDGRIALADDLRDHLAHGDASLAAFERQCDAVAQAHGWGLPAPAPLRPSPDPQELRAPLRTLDLGKERIAAVVWANGAQSDFGWIDVPVFGRSPGPKRRPIHLRGASPARGLYFLGLPWLHKWKSAFLFGADEDAGHVAHCIVADRGARGRAA